MKINRLLSYIFGTIILIAGIVLIIIHGSKEIMTGVSLLLISFVIYPIFDFICKIFNKQFFIGRKLFLIMGTFLFAAAFFSVETVKSSHIFAYLFLVMIFWIIMFASNENRFVDVEKKKIGEESDKKDIFHKFYNSITKKRNAKVRAAIAYENVIKENFRDLNVMTVHSIAKMISETRERHNSVFDENIPEVSISDLVMAFCKDSQRIYDEYELNNLYNKEYYKHMANKYCSELCKHIKNKVRSILPYQTQNRYIEFYNNYFDLFMESMSAVDSLKFYKAVSVYGDDSAVDNVFERLDYRIRDSFRYLVDVLATCTCISKMIFVERKVKDLNKNDEFYNIISNMTKEIKRVETIIEKSRPIYDEFYKSSLGYISDELLYAMAITVLSNRIKSSKFSKQDEAILKIQDKKINDFSTLDKHMREWIYIVADKYRNIEINKYITFKIINTIDVNNFDLLLNILGMTSEYERLYNFNVEHNNKASDKNRYLKGDFEKEKKELSGKYSLNNITTGTQFELYLVNLFKDLGYKAKHNGKSGDQGADLILKKDDYVYAVQAKYYTGKLGNTPVQEITGALKFYNANQGVVITNSEFTPGARELAKANNVILIDGKDLKKLADYAFEDDHSEDVLKKFE